MGFFLNAPFIALGKLKSIERAVQDFLLRSSPRDSSLAKNSFGGGKVHFKS